MAYNLKALDTAYLREFVAAMRATMTKTTDPQRVREVQARLREAEEELAGRPR